MARQPRKKVLTPKPTSQRKPPRKKTITPRLPPKPTSQRKPPRTVTLDLPPRPSPRHEPWTPTQRKRIVEQAVRFIVDARQRHADQLAFEVGEYLFYEVYSADEEYIRKQDPTKTRSLRDIAQGSGYNRRTLADWLRASIIRIRIREAGYDPQLLHSHFIALARLHTDIEAAAALATFADERDLTVKQITKLARRWSDNLAHHGNIEDLLDELDPPPPKPRHRRARTSEVVIPRLLQLVLSWVRTTALTGRQRATLRSHLLEMRSAITGPTS